MILCKKRRRLVGSLVILRGYDTYLFMDIPIGLLRQERSERMSPNSPILPHVISPLNILLMKEVLMDEQTHRFVGVPG